MVSGPSGVGKSTIVAAARARTGADFSVSATTRAPREGEVDGRDYRFVDRPTFEKMIAGGELLEWAEVFGELYGTPARPIRQALAAGRTVLADIDVQGAVQVRRAMPEAVFVLILAPDERELESRLRQRGSEGGAALAARLARAKQEIEDAEATGAYRHRIVNDNLESAIRQLAEVVTQESHSR